jgi:hypothetical protein
MEGQSAATWFAAGLPWKSKEGLTAGRFMTAGGCGTLLAGTKGSRR